MKYLITVSLLASLSVMSATDQTDLTKMTLDELKKYEITFLGKLKEQSATEAEIQEKYLVAAKKFSEVEEHEKAFYLLEKGFAISKPSIGYIYIYLSYIQSLGKNKEFVPAFEKSIKKIDAQNVSKMSDVEIDQASEHIITYMRIKNIPSSKLNPTELKMILDRSTIKDSLNWNDSIVSARNGNYKEALTFLDSVTMVGEADGIYKSYLQAKLGQIPKYCLSIVTFPQKLESFYSKKICKLLSDPGKKKDLDEKLRATGELLEFTPLYEVLKKSSSKN